ncbi:MAG: hypothetical protein JXB88_02955 [Spirochaetales bacterium]|nr:hypothetical protein [Spirochaetales bacterium]
MSLLSDFNKAKEMVDRCDKGGEELLEKCFLSDPFNIDIIRYILQVDGEVSSEFSNKVFSHFIEHFPYASIREQPPEEIMNGNIHSPYHHFDAKKNVAEPLKPEDTVPWIYSRKGKNPRYHSPLLTLYKKVINRMYQDIDHFKILVDQLTRINSFTALDLWTLGLIMDDPEFKEILSLQADTNTDEGKAERDNNFPLDFTSTAKHAFFEAALKTKDADREYFTRMYYTDTFRDRGPGEENASMLYKDLLKDDSLIHLFGLLRCLPEYSVFELDHVPDFNLTEVIKIYVRKTFFLPDSIYRFFNRVYFSSPPVSCPDCGKNTESGMIDTDYYLFNALLVQSGKAKLSTLKQKFPDNPFALFLLAHCEFLKNSAKTTSAFYTLTLLFEAYELDNRNIHIINAIIEYWCAYPFPFFRKRVLKITGTLLQDINFQCDLSSCDPANKNTWMEKYGFHGFVPENIDDAVIEEVNKQMEGEIDRGKLREKFFHPAKHRFFYGVADVLKITGKYKEYFDILKNKAGFLERDFIEQNLFSLYADYVSGKKESICYEKESSLFEEPEYTDYLSMINGS